MFWLWLIFIAFLGAIAVAPQETIHISLVLVWAAMLLAIPVTIIIELLK
ncbi:MAG: hypothetical protein Q8S71_22645 [Hydrogenophaga sp.]|nr:hypothetical protein [Hydrogenophaga sp.]MDP3326331.1 hypothetical protein [Hydrogenophaga sp.]